MFGYKTENGNIRSHHGQHHQDVHHRGNFRQDARNARPIFSRHDDAENKVEKEKGNPARKHNRTSAKDFAERLVAPDIFKTREQVQQAEFTVAKKGGQRYVSNTLNKRLPMSTPGKAPFKFFISFRRR